MTSAENGEAGVAHAYLGHTGWAADTVDINWSRIIRLKHSKLG